MAVAIATGLVVLVILLRVVLTTPAEKLAAFLRIAAPASLIGVGAVLLLLGRGAIGLPIIGLGIAAWRYLRSRGIGKDQPGGEATSFVRSRHFEMRLDHSTGEMDGQLLSGSLAGALLSELDEAEILSLRADVRDDPESLRLLEAYLDRRMPLWREDAKPRSGDGLGSAPGASTMTEKQAYEILGLQPGATLAEIREAHRRLMKRVHPDSGGTDFLAARINEAKAFLVQRHH